MEPVALQRTWLLQLAQIGREGGWRTKYLGFILALHFLDSSHGASHWRNPIRSQKAKSTSIDADFWYRAGWGKRGWWGELKAGQQRWARRSE